MGDRESAELFDAMPHGVPEVEKLPETDISFISLDHGLLYGDAPLDYIFIIIGFDMLYQSLFRDDGALLTASAMPSINLTGGRLSKVL